MTQRDLDERSAKAVLDYLGEAEQTKPCCECYVGMKNQLARHGSAGLGSPLLGSRRRQARIKP